MGWTRTDDRDGSIDDVEPVVVGYKNHIYLMHLGAKNRAVLDEVMEGWIGELAPHRPMPTISDDPPAAAPRAANRPRSARPNGEKSRRVVREDMQAIRAWAREQGHTVNEVGRLSNDLIAAYDSAHPAD